MARAQRCSFNRVFQPIRDDNALARNASFGLFSPDMRRQLSLVLTLAAWLFATGSHWDLVQTFAWGRMFATYAQSMPLLQAVQKTFATDGMCGICEMVQNAKEQGAGDAKTPGAKASEKIFLVSAPGVLTFISPALKMMGFVAAMSAPVSATRAEPSLPPPRFHA